jgi:serine/threonine-protein kinase
LCPTVAEDATTAGPRDPTLRRFGRYEWLVELPAGGMGVVYKAWDPALKIYVALKTLKTARAEEAPDSVERFSRETRALARLDHPHIVRIYDVGRYEGRAYFAMGFMPGGSLDRELDRYREPRLAAGLVEKIARAVHYVHENDIVHRDLKPANILLDEHGEPRLTDFGLAKFRDGEMELTRQGAVLGTPMYMSPEQAGGRLNQIGPATDIWALGVILYQLLTGSRPFQASQHEEVAGLILSAAPPRPRTLKPGLDRALETIVLKCLEKRPEDRYASAAALATDLGLWLSGESILAQPPSAATRLARFIGRHSTAAAAAALLTAFVLIAPFLIGANAAGREQAELRQIQEQNLEQVRQEMGPGIAAELLPLRGRPESYKRRVGNPTLFTLAGEVLTLELGSFRVGALDLLPASPQDSYRFSADVNITVTTTRRGTGGGIYVAAAECEGPDGWPEQWFVTLGFPEFSDPPAVVCQLHRYFGPPSLRDPQTTYLFSGPLPSQGGTADKHWQHLQIDVSTEEIVPWYEGKPIAKIGREHLEKGLQELAGRIPVSAKFPLVEGLLHGPPGLWTRNADTMFRNATVEPLP